MLKLVKNKKSSPLIEGFLHVQNCRSPVPYPDLLRPESYRSAAGCTKAMKGYGDLKKKAVSKSFSRIVQSVLSDCKPLPRFRQLVLSDCNRSLEFDNPFSRVAIVRIEGTNCISRERIVLFDLYDLYESLEGTWGFS